jgi:Fe2+ transport system protein FeoA
MKIKYLAHTNLKSTYEIQVGKMNIALRKDEAQKIEVEKR